MLTTQKNRNKERKKIDKLSKFYQHDSRAEKAHTINDEIENINSIQSQFL